MNTSDTIELSIVVPVYREEKSISEFLRRIAPILSSISHKYEIIFALDPSPDRTEEIILEHRIHDERIKLIRFSRRFGQPMAVLGGMQYSSGKAVIVMDVDLQDPPEIIPELVSKWKNGNDVVLAQRRTRKGDTWFKNTVSRIGYMVMKRVSNPPIPANTGDFRLMSRRVVEEVLKLKESHGYLRGLVAFVGFRQAIVEFDRVARFAGQTSYNRFFGSIKIAMNGLICFSNYFLRLSSHAGFLIAGCSILLGIVYAVMKIAGFPFPLGNPTIVILILFMGGIQLMSVGILGEYISRIYEEVKQRPKFIIDEMVGFSKK